MKIENNPILQLQIDEAHRKSGAGKAGEFDALLNAEMQTEGIGQTVTASTGQSAAAIALQMQAAQALGTTEEASATAQEDEALVVSQLGGLLDEWDSYAAAVSGTSGDLRSAYGILERMSANLKSIKEASPALTGEGGQLAALVNELEVMATTETFKFNRGDYL